MTSLCSGRATDALVVAARRTPIGRRNGLLAGLHPHDLLAAAQHAALVDSGVAPEQVDQIITGCVTQIGDQAYNIARMAALSSGLPMSVPATTVDAQCGSSHQAVNLAAALISSGTADVVLASGVESMSRVPLGSAGAAEEFGSPYSAGYGRRYEKINQGESAERIADRWSITRAQCDEWAELSQRRAGAAVERDAFAGQLVPIPAGELVVQRDEGVRPTTKEALAGLRASFRPAGRHTAGNSSQISDGAAAVVVMSRRTVERVGVLPLARIDGQAFVGVDPVLKLTGAIDATRAVLERSGVAMDEIDLVEVSEAFAAVVLAWFAETGADPQRVNVNGGAIALGHPVGASGARMITTLVHEMQARKVSRGLVAMCCGGGLGTATLLSAPTF